jgi:hypothetical protein
MLTQKYIGNKTRNSKKGKKQVVNMVRETPSLKENDKKGEYRMQEILNRVSGGSSLTSMSKEEKRAWGNYHVRCYKEYRYFTDVDIDRLIDWVVSDGLAPWEAAEYMHENKIRAAEEKREREERKKAREASGYGSEYDIPYFEV